MLLAYFLRIDKRVVAAKEFVAGSYQSCRRHTFQYFCTFLHIVIVKDKKIIKKNTGFLRQIVKSYRTITETTNGFFKTDRKILPDNHRNNKWVRNDLDFNIYVNLGVHRRVEL